jgi:hypothetical protein
MDRIRKLKDALIFLGNSSAQGSELEEQLKKEEQYLGTMLDAIDRVRKTHPVAGNFFE